jgi:segregation and condensation protein A
VSLVAVTEPFLAFVDTIIEASPEVVAEFTAVGARLTLLKSRSLLPRIEDPGDEAEPSDLTQQLREYQRVKVLASRLQSLSPVGPVSYPADVTGGAIVRPTSTVPLRLAHYEASSLARSLRRRLAAVPRPATIVRQRPVVTLRELVVRVSEHLERFTTVRFSSVTRDYETRTGVATAFLAVLVLVRRGTASASQDFAFGDIDLEAREVPPTAASGTATDEAADLFRYPSREP